MTELPPKNDFVTTRESSWFTFIEKVLQKTNINLIAYIVGLFLVCVLAVYETKRAEEYLANVPKLATDSPIPSDRQTIMPDYDSMRWIEMAQAACA